MANATVTLPFPPSVNNLFSQNRQGRRFTSKNYARWKQAAGLTVIAARMRPVPTPVMVQITLTPADKRKRDGDNLIKPIADLLVSLGVLPDDSNKHVNEYRVTWSGGVCPKNPRAVVEITSLQK